MSSLIETIARLSWWICFAPAVVGAGLLFRGLRRGDSRLMSSAVAAFALSLLLVLGRLFIETDRTRMEHRTVEIVRAVDRKDFAGLRKLLDTTTHVQRAGASSANGGDEVDAAAKAAVELAGLSHVSVIHIDSVQTDTLITVSVDVTSTQEATMGRPLTTSWQLDYEQKNDRWVLDAITLLRVGQDSSNSSFRGQ